MLQIFPLSPTFLEKIATQQYRSLIPISPFRGTIYDRRRIPLAISIRTPSIVINPRQFKPDKFQLTKLSGMVGIPPKDIQDLILRRKEKYFVWLRRKVSNQVAEQVTEAGLTGVHVVIEPARYYPKGSSAAHLLGYVGTDNIGLLGLELAYDEKLRADTSALFGLKDARGKRILMDSKKVFANELGDNLVLTLDHAIQEIAQEALEIGVHKANAKQGFVIVSEVNSGKILAIANYPSFNPNNPRGIEIDRTQNLALGLRFEPGSVLKPFVVALALDQGLVDPGELLNCEPSGRFQVGPKQYIHDEHPKGELTMEQVLIHSSNICTFKIAQRLGKESLYHGLKKFGFALKNPRLNLPGEGVGYIAPWQRWKPIRFANISFGQGMLVTGLEVVQGMSVIANGGLFINPYLVEALETAKGKVIERVKPTRGAQIISQEAAKQMIKILTDVVVRGTGSRAKGRLYTSAGKTGTAEKIDPLTKAYSGTKRIASFAGFAPAQAPHLAAYVVIDEPGNRPFYGGLWAAPVFAQIMERALKYLNIPRSTPPILQAENYSS